MTTYRIPKLRIRMVRERATITLATPDDAASAIRGLTCDEDPTIERFVALFSDGKNHIVGGSVVAMGGRNSLVVRPAEVFRPAIVAGASGIIVGHNHPSGCPEPSDADLSMTRALVAAGEVLGLPVLDHVIVTEYDSHSMLEHHEGGL